MKELALILKHNNIPFELEGEDTIRFQYCKICKNESNPGLNIRSYYCPMCEIDAISLSEFFKKIGISYDPSSSEFTGLLTSTIDDLFDADRTIGISTGYQSLDREIKGIRKGHTYLLAADTGMGKSVFAVNLALNQIKEGCKVIYLDLENGREASQTRFIAIQGLKPISFFEIPSNKGEALEIASTLKDKLYYFDHVRLASMMDGSEGTKQARALADLIKLYVQEHGVSFAVIDPLENFELEQTDYNSIGKVVEIFKNLAQELRISILILHHLKKSTSNSSEFVDSLSSEQVRPPKYRIPVIDDIVGSKKITNKATDVWVIVRQKDHKGIEQGKILLRTFKQREGQTAGDVYFFMNTENLKIAEVAVEYYPGQNLIEGYGTTN